MNARGPLSSPVDQAPRWQRWATFDVESQAHLKASSKEHNTSKEACCVKEQRDIVDSVLLEPANRMANLASCQPF
jgi:hypothetical protein